MKFSLPFFVLMFIIFTAYNYSPYRGQPTLQQINSDAPTDISTHYVYRNQPIAMKDKNVDCFIGAPRPNQSSAELVSKFSDKVRQFERISGHTPQYLISEAKLGNSAAAVAAFHSIAGCTRFADYYDFLGTVADDNMPLSADQCKEIPASFISSPLSIFSATVDKPPEVKLILAKNLLIELTARVGEDKITAAERQRELIIIENLALGAAQAQLPDAYLFLAWHYDAGTFGAADPLKAQQFSEMYRPTPDDLSYRNGLTYFRQRIGTRHRDSKDSCAAESDNATIFINPFSIF